MPKKRKIIYKIIYLMHSLCKKQYGLNASFAAYLLVNINF